MALPDGFNSRQVPGRRTFRFFKSDAAATINFADKAFLFTEGSNVTPLPTVTPQPDGPTPAGTTALPQTPTGGGTTDPGSPVPMIWSGTLRIINDGGALLEFSFDGVNVHGALKAGEELSYRNRIESGIAFRSPTAVSVAFRVEAW